MPAQGEGTQDLCGMILVVAGDADQIEIAAFEQSLGTVERFRARKALRGLVQLRRIAIAECDELAVRMLREAERMLKADAESDHAGTQRRHASTPGLP